ncbi:hypothetical protein T190130A13A_50133 [Tenacibaculum sp. 190130A14a]|uniref:Uncharacterized protein n=1 Tax=Tenacibaculum polynesiense TaxID=3137857 RepID=A0ABM9PEE8_9FLAO
MVLTSNNSPAFAGFFIFATYQIKNENFKLHFINNICNCILYAIANLSPYTMAGAKIVWSAKRTPKGCRCYELVFNQIIVDFRNTCSR